MIDNELMTLNRCPECMAFKDGKCSVDFGWIRRLCTSAFAAGRRTEQLLRERDALTNKCETCANRIREEALNFCFYYYDCIHTSSDFYKRRNDA